MKNITVINRHHDIPPSGAARFYIGRGSACGNPFVIGKDGTREEVIEKFKQHAEAEMKLPRSVFREAVMAIAATSATRDVELECFCAPQKCHGETITQLCIEHASEAVRTRERTYEEFDESESEVPRSTRPTKRTDSKSTTPIRERKPSALPGAISKFDGPNSFLSIFYRCEIPYEGLIYPSVGHAFEAAKFKDIGCRRSIMEIRSIPEVKALGARLPRSEEERLAFEEKQLDILTDLFRVKFSDAQLSKQLINTGQAPLIAGNGWNDTYLGVYKGQGENHQGKILMKLRDEIQQKQPEPKAA